MRKLGLLGLLLAIALVIAACGSNAGSSGGSQGDDQGGSQNGGMHGMDHGGSGGGSAREETTGGMSGMDHGDMGGMDHGSSGMAAMSRRMVMPNGKYSDKAFIDMMVPHHQGAIEMAQVALKNAEHPEVKNLAGNIVSAQEKEIGELKNIKKEEYGTSEVPMQMSADQMRGMGMMDNPQELAKEKPFDKAFIDAMIPHHQSAIVMASVALEESKNPQIRELARNIVSAQEREIKEMKGWREEWYQGS